MNATLISEGELSIQLGLSLAELKGLRAQSVEHQDWLRDVSTPGRPVLWTASGVEALKTQMKLNELKREMSTRDRTPQRARVLRCNFRNKRLVLAAVQGVGEWLVLVRDAGQYREGQEISVRQNGAGWMEARPPRKRGVS